MTRPADDSEQPAQADERAASGAGQADSQRDEAAPSDAAALPVTEPAVPPHETATMTEPTAQPNETAAATEPSAPPREAATTTEPAAPPAVEPAQGKRRPPPAATPPSGPELAGAELAAAAHDPMGAAARSMALAGLLGSAMVMWSQLTFKARWVTKFLISNELNMERRMTLIYSMVGGVLAGAITCALVLGVFRWRKRSIESVERALWFVSPLILLPAIPTLFRHKSWTMRHEELLLAVLPIMLLLEVLLVRSLSNVHQGVVRGYRWLAERTPGIWKKHGPLIVVVAGALFYALFMSHFALLWHYKLRTHNFDLAINNNLLYGGLHGVFMESPVSFYQEPEKYLSAHAKYGGYVFLPIYALYPKPETLIVLQSSLLGLGAIPLFAFARRRLSGWMAAGLAIAYLCYYPMQSANFYEVKFVPIAAFFVIATVWAVDAKRWVIFGLCFPIAMLMREDMPIGMAVIGAFLLLSGHRPKAGLVMALVSSVWFYFIRFHVMESAGDWWFPKMYRDLWSPGETGFKSVVKTMLSNPLFTLDKIINTKKVYYLMHVFVPLAFLPARRWYLWMAFIPGILLTLLSTDYEPVYRFSFQYVMHWTPYIFLAAAVALSALGRDPMVGRIRARAALIAALFATAVLQFNFGAFPAREGTFRGGFFTVSFELTEQDKQRYAQLMEIIEVIPDDASVAATENIGPHVSSRLTMYALRQGPQDAEYLLVSSKELKLDNTKPKLKAALNRGIYGVVKRIGEFAVFKKGYDTSGNAQLMRDWRM